MPKFVQNKKNLNLGPKMPYIWIFLGCNFKKLLSCLKSPLSNLPEYKVLCKNKSPEMWDQK